MINAQPVLTMWLLYVKLKYLYINSFISTFNPYQPYEVGTSIIPVFQLRKLSLLDIKELYCILETEIEYKPKIQSQFFNHHVTPLLIKLIRKFQHLYLILKGLSSSFNVNFVEIQEKPCYWSQKQAENRFKTRGTEKKGRVDLKGRKRPQV